MMAKQELCWGETNALDRSFVVCRMVQAALSLSNESWGSVVSFTILFAVFTSSAWPIDMLLKTVLHTPCLEELLK